MMEAVGLVDPALVEQAAGPARRHSARRPLRTGLIAACLCAALLGSAWAANQIGGFQSLKFFPFSCFITFVYQIFLVIHTNNLHIPILITTFHHDRIKILTQSPTSPAPSRPEIHNHEFTL